MVVFAKLWGNAAARPPGPTTYEQRDAEHFYWHYRPDEKAGEDLLKGGLGDVKVPRAVVNDKVYWGPSTLPQCGNGVFARVDIQPGDIIEIGPLVLDTDQNWAPPKRHAHPLHENYTIEYAPLHMPLRFRPHPTRRPQTTMWSRMFGGPRTAPKVSAFMLGYGSLYNHSDEPNAAIEWGAAETFLVICETTPIKAGEEIFIDYGADYWESFAKPVAKVAKAAVGANDAAGHPPADVGAPQTATTKPAHQKPNKKRVVPKKGASAKIPVRKPPPKATRSIWRRMLVKVRGAPADSESRNATPKSGATGSTSSNALTSHASHNRSLNTVRKPDEKRRILGGPGKPARRFRLRGRP